MIEISMEVLTSLQNSVRTKSASAIPELQELALACVMDLETSGVYVTDANDPLTLQALKLYCKANYGYDAETDVKKFREGYYALRNKMALCGDYERGDQVG